MYLAINIPRYISTLGGILFLTASCTIIQIFKCTGSPPHLLMLLQVPQICSILLFWKPFVPYTSLSDSMGPCLKQQQVWYTHTLPIFVADNPILGVAF